MPSTVDSVAGPLCSAVLRHGKLNANNDILRNSRRRGVRFIDAADVIDAVCTACVAAGGSGIRTSTCNCNPDMRCCCTMPR
eukprot:9412679-Alexandrium_andersonii.AAC.1